MHRIKYNYWGIIPILFIIVTYYDSNLTSSCVCQPTRNIKFWFHPYFDFNVEIIAKAISVTHSPWCILYPFRFRGSLTSSTFVLGSSRSFIHVFCRPSCVVCTQFLHYFDFVKIPTDHPVLMRHYKTEMV